MPDAQLVAPSGESKFLTDAFMQEGQRFTWLAFGKSCDVPDDIGVIRIDEGGDFVDPQGLAGRRYDAEPGTGYLLRPDGYVAARFRHPTRAALDAALSRACRLN
jgi:3-(3-hydroxy-phenyl)propionate hydroxylase